MSTYQNPRPVIRPGARANPIPPKTRVTIHDVAKDPSPKLFVVNMGPKLFKQPSITSFTYRGDDGEPLPIEVENTWIPRDIAELVSKDELLKNTTLRGLVAKGILELMRSDEAEKILATQDAIVEVDRLAADKMRRQAAGDPTKSTTQDGEFKTLPNPPSNLPQGAKGDYDESLRGVSPAVAECARSTEYSDAERRSMLRTLLPTMTMPDVDFLRSEDQLAGDADLHALVDAAEADIRANSR